MEWTAFAMSAAVGAFAGALITAIANGIDHWRTREATRKSAIFERALEMAKLKIEVSLRVVERQGGNIYLQDPVVYAEEYHQALEHLHRCGRVPDDMDHHLPIWKGETPTYILKRMQPE